MDEEGLADEEVILPEQPLKRLLCFLFAFLKVGVGIYGNISCCNIKFIL